MNANQSEDSAPDSASTPTTNPQPSAPPDRSETLNPCPPPPAESTSIAEPAPENAPAFSTVTVPETRDALQPVNTASAILPATAPQRPTLNSSTSLLLAHHPSAPDDAPVPHPPAVIDTKPVNAPTARRKIRRNGRVASLPRVQRDMVNRMLWNAVPYKNIVAALDEQGFAVTERNISSWATGGYLEWSLAQEHVLQNRLNQDQLLDFLRRDDAPELPEVGLQAAATQVSNVLIQSMLQAHASPVDLDKISKLVDLLCRLNRELVPLQKQRDDSRRTLGREYDPARIKESEASDAITTERYYSNPDPDSGLPKPQTPPLLPPEPTSSLLADQDREAQETAEAVRLARMNQMMRMFSGQPASAPASRQLQNPPPSASK